MQTSLIDLVIDIQTLSTDDFDVSPEYLAFKTAALKRLDIYNGVMVDYLIHQVILISKCHQRWYCCKHWSETRWGQWPVGPRQLVRILRSNVLGRSEQGARSSKTSNMLGFKLGSLIAPLQFQTFFRGGTPDLGKSTVPFSSMASHKLEIRGSNHKYLQVAR